MVSEKLIPIRRRLDQIPVTEGEYAVFDFDNTCIYNDIGEAVLAYLCLERKLKNLFLLDEEYPSAYYYKKVFERFCDLSDRGDILGASKLAYLALVGYSRQEIEQIVGEVLGYEGYELGEQDIFGRKFAKGLRIRGEAKELMDLARHRKSGLWVVTASGQVLVESMLRRWFPEYPFGCIGLTSEEEKGLLTERLVGPLPVLENKVTAIQARIHSTRRPILAAGDSPNDRAMLEYAEIKVVADRGNDLTRIARERGWYLI